MTTETAIVKCGTAVAYDAGLGKAGKDMGMTYWSETVESNKPTKLAERLQALSAGVEVHEVLKHYSGKRVALNIRVLPVRDGEEGVPSMLVEGDEDTLLFLADLLLAQVQDSDCGTEISPTGPGKVFFSPQSQHGIYIHVLPCKHPPSHKMP